MTRRGAGKVVSTWTELLVTWLEEFTYAVEFGHAVKKWLFLALFDWWGGVEGTLGIGWKWLTFGLSHDTQTMKKLLENNYDFGWDILESLRRNPIQWQM